MLLLDEVPKGWKTSEQLVDEWGKSRTTVLAMLRGLLRKKKWKVQTFRVVHLGRSSYPTPHYLPIQQSLKSAKRVK